VDRTDPDSPASSAGLRRGDVLVRVGDVKVACSFDVERGLLERKAGDAVPVVYLRHGKEQRKDLVLQAPANRSRASLSELVWEKLGVKFSPVAAEQVSRANRQLHGGLEVTTLSADGLAAKAGIRKGDVLVGLHQWETVSVDNVAFVLTHPDLASFNPLSFYVVRGGQVRRGSLQIEDGK
jgi:serine protease Do